MRRGAHKCPALFTFWKWVGSGLANVRMLLEVAMHLEGLANVMIMVYDKNYYEPTSFPL